MINPGGPKSALIHLAWLFLSLSCLSLASLAAQATSILVVLSESTPIYLEFANTLRKEMASEPVSIDLVAADAESALPARSSDLALIVTVGSRAAEFVVARDSRSLLLLTLLPRSAVERIAGLRRDERRISAIYIDQPPARYIELLRAALPDYERVGLLAGQDSRETATRLAAVARDRRLRPLVEQVGSEPDIYPALQRMFAEPGILLATADTTVFNSQTIPSILLSAYRRRVPVVGFSQAYVRAGAVVALYSTPAQIALQTTEAVRAVLNGQGLPSAQYPRYFQVGVNARVAKSLDLRIDSEAVIRERLERMERQP